MAPRIPRARRPAARGGASGLHGCTAPPRGPAAASNGVSWYQLSKFSPGPTSVGALGLLGHELVTATRGVHISRCDLERQGDIHSHRGANLLFATYNTSRARQTLVLPPFQLAARGCRPGGPPSPGPAASAARPAPARRPLRRPHASRSRSVRTEDHAPLTPALPGFEPAPVRMRDPAPATALSPCPLGSEGGGAGPLSRPKYLPIRGPISASVWGSFRCIQTLGRTALERRITTSPVAARERVRTGGKVRLRNSSVGSAAGAGTARIANSIPALHAASLPRAAVRPPPPRLPPAPRPPFGTLARPCHRGSRQGAAGASTGP